MTLSAMRRPTVLFCLIFYARTAEKQYKYSEKKSFFKLVKSKRAIICNLFNILFIAAYLHLF